MMQATLEVEPGKRVASRVQSVDLLRGAVMIIMALDHTRDFFHSQAYQFSPEDLRQTYPLLFFTRWITHFCAPIFVFLAGVSVHLSSAKRVGKAEVAASLVKRGLWLIFLEWTLFEFMWTFNFHYQLVALQVIWVIGWGMLTLAALIWLPRRLIAAIAIAFILGHNAFDSVRAASFGQFAWLWNVLHAVNFFPEHGTLIMVLYPLVPWIFVLAAGYCFGPVLQMEEARRKRILLRLGLSMTIAFALLRWLGIYGDPQPWAHQKTLALTVVSFFRVTKYPPSLEFLLMTLGPAMLFLWTFDRVRVSEANPLRVYGRTAMFYYACHFYLIHLTAEIFSAIRYRRWDVFLHFPGALFGVPDPTFPKDWGYTLGETYLIWAAIVASLYLPCRWWLEVKQRSRSWWVHYF
jgi:uncharacterized membrane protein